MEILFAIKDFNILRFELFTVGTYFSLSFFETRSEYSLFSITVISSKESLGFYLGIFYKEICKEFIKKI